MFDSIYSTSVTASQFFIMAGLALASGVLFAWIMSFRIRSTKRFFLVAALVPAVVGCVITFMSGNIAGALAIGGAFTLVRFRSAQGSADEIVAILIAMAAGIAFGAGRVGYGVCILLGLSVVAVSLSLQGIFEHPSLSRDMLLRVTIPESLDYTGAFDDVFAHYLSGWSAVGVKTTGMGSMFRLSFKIRMKDQKEEKPFIDELLTKTGNLEIALLPFVEEQNQL